MKNKHMLPCPFADMPVTVEDIRSLLTDVEVRQSSGGATLHIVLTHLLYRTLVGMASRSRGKRAANRTAFVVGAGLVGHDLAKAALGDIERGILLPLLNLDDGTDAIYDEIAAFGRQAIAEGEIGADGVLRV